MPYTATLTKGMKAYLPCGPKGGMQWIRPTPSYRPRLPIGMRIKCLKWQEAVANFLDPETIARMRKLGLRVERLAWEEKTVFSVPYCRIDPSEV